MKRRVPKRRNLAHRDAVLSGAMRPRVVEDKKKADQPRKQKHRKLTETDHDD